MRKVVTDGATSVALWIADQEWEATCASRGHCVSQEMVDAVAERFLRPGANNDIYDWVTAIFGAPWGPNSAVGEDGEPLLIPAEAAREVHIFAFDIGNDGYISGNAHRRLFLPGAQPAARARSSLSPTLARTAGVFHELAVTGDGTGRDMGRDRPHTQGLARHPGPRVSAHDPLLPEPVLRDAANETWLNEQASEVAEDLIADKLMIDGPRGVAFDDPTAYPQEVHGYASSLPKMILQRAHSLPRGFSFGVNRAALTLSMHAVRFVWSPHRK